MAILFGAMLPVFGTTKRLTRGEMWAGFVCLLFHRG